MCVVGDYPVGIVLEPTEMDSVDCVLAGFPDRGAAIGTMDVGLSIQRFVRGEQQVFGFMLHVATPGNR